MKKLLLLSSILIGFIFSENIFAQPAANIPLTVTDSGNVARVNEPVTCGVPLPEGVYFDASQFQVQSGGSPVPSQCGVLNYWADSSIRFLRANFTANVAANSSATYNVVNTGGAVASSSGPLTYVESGDTIRVGTGPITVQINKAHFNLFDKVWVGNKLVVNSSSTDGGVIKNGANIYSTANFPCQSASWDEKGIYKAVLKLRGWYSPANTPSYNYSYTVRFYFTSGSDRVGVDISVENGKWTLYKKVYEMDHMSVSTSLAITGNQYLLGGDNGNPITGPLSGTVTLNQPLYNSFTVTGGTTGSMAYGFCDVSDGNYGVAVGVRDFWQQFAKTVNVSPGNIDVRLWTEDDTLKYIQFACKKTHNMLFYFHAGDASAANVADVMKGFTKVMVPRPDYDWITKTMALPGFMNPIHPDPSIHEPSANVPNNYGPYPANYYGWAAYLGFPGNCLSCGGAHLNQYNVAHMYLMSGSYSHLIYNWNEALNFAEIKQWWNDELTELTYPHNQLCLKDSAFQAFFGSVYGYGAYGYTFPAPVVDTFPGYKKHPWPFSGVNTEHWGLTQIFDSYLMTGDYRLRDALIAEGNNNTPTVYMHLENYALHYGNQSLREVGWDIYNLANAYSINRDPNLKECVARWAGGSKILHEFGAKELLDSSSGSGNDFGIECNGEWGVAPFENSLLVNGVHHGWEATRDPHLRDILWGVGIWWKDFSGYDPIGCPTGATSTNEDGLPGYAWCVGDPHIEFNQCYWHPDFPRAWGYCYRLSSNRQWKQVLKTMAMYNDPNPTYSANPIYFESGLLHPYDIDNPQLQWAIFETRGPGGADTIAPAAAHITASPAGAGEVMITFNVPSHQSQLKEYVLKYDSIIPFNPYDSLADGVTDNYFWRGEDANMVPKSPCRSSGPDTLYASGLTIGKTYHFALKTYDIYTNLSRVSNDASSVPGTSGAIHTHTGPCTTVTGITSMDEESGFGAYPNPANTEVNFRWTDKSAQKVSVKIYNDMGQQVGLIDSENKSGAEGLRWNVAQTPPGIYLYQATLTTSDKTENILPMKKMTVVH